MSNNGNYLPKEYESYTLPAYVRNYVGLPCHLWRVGEDLWQLIGSDKLMQVVAEDAPGARSQLRQRAREEVAHEDKRVSRYVHGPDPINRLAKDLRACADAKEQGIVLMRYLKFDLKCTWSPEDVAKWFTTVQRRRET